jgi:hypothetical protein
MKRIVVALWFCIAGSAALAHEPSRSLLKLAVDDAGVRGRLDVSLRDLEDAVGLDADGDAAITWAEVQARSVDIAGYASRRLALEADGQACPLSAGPVTVDRHGGAIFAVVDLAAECPAAPRSLRAAYGLLFDLDPAHRALVEISAGGASTTAVLSDGAPVLEVEVTALSQWTSFARFVAEGVTHIWHGYDHLAFVALLVLPLVLGGARRNAPERPSARSVVVSIAGVVTAFTAAHSLTLALATLGLVSVPTRAVEAVIALSVLVAALLNVLPRVPRLGARLAFGFGLVHGFGFATALGDLGAGEAGIAASLAGFNVGVELGQLGVVAAALPVLLALRGHAASRAALNYACSAVCAGLAVVWLTERLAFQ